MGGDQYFDLWEFKDLAQVVAGNKKEASPFN